MGYPRTGSQSVKRARGSMFVRGFPAPVRPDCHLSKCHAIVVWNGLQKTFNFDYVDGMFYRPQLTHLNADTRRSKIVVISCFITHQCPGDPSRFIG
ncbi:hypothetical protein VRRI112168_12875 [Vreelandella rituensis]